MFGVEATRGNLARFGLILCLLAGIVGPLTFGIAHASCDPESAGSDPGDLGVRPSGFCQAVHTYPRAISDHRSAAVIALLVGAPLLVALLGTSVAIRRRSGDALRNTAALCLATAVGLVILSLALAEVSHIPEG